MPMVPCKECSKGVSTDARVCPHCGKKLRIGGIAKLVLILAAVLGVFIIIGIIGNAVQNASKTPQEAAADAAEGQHLQVMIGGAMALRKAMRDPNSFKVTQVLDMPDGAVCYSYQAKNGFGGMDEGEAVLFNGKFLESSMDGFQQLNEQECEGKTGKVETDFINSELKNHAD
jgi:hypothetical protein